MKSERTLTLRTTIAAWTAILLLAAGLSPALAAPPVKVTSAVPNETEEDTLNLDVEINGGGFEPGAAAHFYRTGTSDPGGIVVNSTTYLSPKKVKANIDAPLGTDIDLYDIEIELKDTRRGKGIELFRVKEKTTGPPQEPTVDFPAFVYVATSDSPGVGIYVTDVEGLVSEEIVSPGPERNAPTWSPDGETVVYVEEPDGETWCPADIYTVSRTAGSWGSPVLLQDFAECWDFGEPNVGGFRFSMHWFEYVEDSTSGAVASRIAYHGQGSTWASILLLDPASCVAGQCDITEVDTGLGNEAIHRLPHVTPDLDPLTDGYQGYLTFNGNYNQALAHDIVWLLELEISPTKVVTTGPPIQLSTDRMWFPTFSPASTEGLLLISAVAGDQLRVMEVTGCPSSCAITAVSDDFPADDQHPQWSPDGEHIAWCQRYPKYRKLKNTFDVTYTRVPSGPTWPSWPDPATNVTRPHDRWETQVDWHPFNDLP